MKIRARRAVPLFALLLAGLMAPDAAIAQTATQQREAAVLRARAGQTAEAIATLRSMLAKGIDDGLVAMDLVTLLQQDGKAAEAVAAFERAARRDPPDYALLAAARAYRDVNDPMKALSLYIAVSAAAREHALARREAAGILEGLAAPHGAARLGGVTRSIEAQQAAAMVRDGEMQLDEAAGRYEMTDAAIARLDQLLTTTPATDTEMRRRLRLDRLVALRNRLRMAALRTEGDALRRDAPLPPYAEEAYADALLYLREPAPARDAYRRILAVNPRDVEAVYGVFYASIELEDFDTAYAVIDALVANEPVWRGYQGDPTQYDNPARMRAELTAARARLYGDQLGEAWRRIDHLSATAPAQSDARVAASQVSLARGWPARAAREAGIAASLSPPSIDARIALAEAAMANQQLGDADRIAQELTAQVPEHLGVQRLTRDVKTSRRWLFAVDAEPGTSEGGGANASGEVLTLDGRLTSPPLGDHWRIFVLAGSQHAHPPEGYTDRTRAGVGLEWRSASLSAAVFPTQSWGALSKAGVGATIDWFAGDHVQLSVAAEHFAWETPLRALLQGITADDISARAAYRWHESRSVSANVSYQPFTDGNRRIAGGLQYREAFVSRPGLRVTGTGDAYASSNELTSVPYYSPPRDFSLTGGALIQHVVWRRYDHSLVQQLGGDVGLYAERGFDRNWLATLSYEHHWRFDPLTSFHYGLRWTRRVYDGAAENSLIFITGLAQRF